ncbi:hypothetical protein RFN29_34370 [Mesorhizobium sp. VK22B]|uniref:Uncharacterized protein n=1 Tax=Mesorhizobium captivum TaxID=3072319 RepID=A0ABU4ZEA1_9HYPH|nr:hypothetical protein [Mesorhizobium sp. VK22B]MDX8496595.1 hypothetical protein [Mesorhizobium sp. VK22B]
MKVTLISEDFRDGMQVDWPAIPRAGEFVSLRHIDGTAQYVVDGVEYVCDTNGVLTEARVDLGA